MKSTLAIPVLAMMILTACATPEQAAPSSQAPTVAPTHQVNLRACNKHDTVSGVLRSKFGERVAGTGITHDGQLMEIYTSPDGVWTIVLTSPSGWSCLVSSGKFWRLHDVVYGEGV